MFVFLFFVHRLFFLFSLCSKAKNGTIVWHELNDYKTDMLPAGDMIKNKGGICLSEKKTNKPGHMAGLLVQLKKIFGLNIATIAFGVLLIYMVFTAVLLITSTHIESYQVTTGPLSRNETYTGLSIREESVFKAESSGYVNYYAREGSKINAGGAVYGLSSGKTSETSAALSSEDLAKIRSSMLSFSKSFSGSKFNNTYSFKNQLEGSILQYEGISTDGNASSQVVSIGGQNVCKAQEDGIILYSMDGYENKTVDTLTAEDFDQTSYHETDLKTDAQIQTGDNIYANITSELWSLIIPLSDKQAAKLQGRTTIRVKFLKDGMTQSGDFSIVKIDGAKYGKIDFSRGLIRYASERFLDIELVTNTVTGLKIPLSANTYRDFYVISSEYSTTDANGVIGFNKVSKDSDGNTVKTFIKAGIYGKLVTGYDSSGKKEICDYYVDKSAFKEGDALVKNNSNQRFIVSETISLEGVYCINQGYPVFRWVEILDQNEEYAIISSSTSYGLSRYDRIARDSSQVKE